MITSTGQIILSRNWNLLAIAAIPLTFFLSSPAVSHTPDFPEANVIRGRTAAGYPYLNGGISFAEQHAIERAADPYNLKLIFANRAGTLVSPHFVMIGMNQSAQIEKIPLRAPWLYIQLPPGGYTILARFKGQVVLVRDVFVDAAGRRTYLLRGD
jgi:hypothetical protein